VSDTVLDERLRPGRHLPVDEAAAEEGGVDAGAQVRPEDGEGLGDEPLVPDRGLEPLDLVLDVEPPSSRVRPGAAPGIGGGLEVGVVGGEADRRRSSISRPPRIDAGHRPVGIGLHRGIQGQGRRHRAPFVARRSGEERHPAPPRPPPSTPAVPWRPGPDVGYHAEARPRSNPGIPRAARRTR